MYRRAVDIPLLKTNFIAPNEPELATSVACPGFLSAPFFVKH